MHTCASARSCASPHQNLMSANEKLALAPACAHHPNKSRICTVHRACVSTNQKLRAHPHPRASRLQTGPHAYACARLRPRLHVNQPETCAPSHAHGSPDQKLRMRTRVPARQPTRNLRLSLLLCDTRPKNRALVSTGQKLALLPASPNQKLARTPAATRQLTKNSHLHQLLSVN